MKYIPLSAGAAGSEGGGPDRRPGLGVEGRHLSLGPRRIRPSPCIISATPEPPGLGHPARSAPLMIAARACGMVTMRLSSSAKRTR